MAWVAYTATPAAVLQSWSQAMTRTPSSVLRLRPNGSTCIACPPGTFGPRSGATDQDDCNPCPINSYQPEHGAGFVGECLPCPINSGAPEGSASPEDCVCNEGY